MQNIHIIVDEEVALSNIEEELKLDILLDGIVLDIFYDMFQTGEIFIISCEIEDILQEKGKEGVIITPFVEDVIFQSLDVEDIKEKLYRDWRNNGKDEERLIRPSFSEKFLLEKNGKWQRTGILEHSNELVLTGWNRKFSSTINSLVFVGE